MAEKILVCNLTRFGDLLQTQPLIEDLALAGYQVSLLSLENFAEAASLLRHVKQVHPLPGAALLAGINSNWPKAAHQLYNFIQSIIQKDHPDIVLNLTPTLSARLLTRLFGQMGCKVHGFSVDEAGFGINDSVWASFIAVAANKRIDAPFNLADMLRRMALPLSKNVAGSFQLAPLPDSAVAWGREFLKSAAPRKAKGYVALQLGASENRRRWPLTNFLEIGRKLWEEEKLCPILLGSAREAELGRKYAQNASHPFINAIGQTDLPKLGALLKSTRLLITNDTGTMHYAAGLEVPSLAFFLATAQPWDTGPLLPGCCCLEPRLACHPCAFGSRCSNNEICRQTITPENVYQLIQGWLQDGNWQKNLTQDISSQCRVWITGKSASGYNLVTSTGKQEQRSFWLETMRQFWSQLLDEMSGLTDRQPANFKTGEARNLQDAPKLAAMITDATNILDSILACGQICLENPRGGQLLLRNCDRLQNLLAQVPAFETLGAFWRELRQNQGNSLDKFLPAAAILKDNLARFGSILKSEENTA